MKKLKLDVDRLAVESFTTAGGKATVGTVHGYYPTYTCDTDVTCQQTCFFISCFATDCYCDVNSYADTCNADYTNSCGNTCYQSCFTCNGTCNTCAGTCQTC